MQQPHDQIQLFENEPLARYTSWRIGGPARFYCEATTVEELRRILRWGYEQGLPLFLLGGGTNILIRDEGFAGLVVRYRSKEWRIEKRGDSGLLYAEAGVPIGRLVWSVGAQGWSNMEWAAGLPGTLGGAVYGNAGCYGGDIASMLNRAWILVDNEVQEWPLERLGFGYRSSILKTMAQEMAQESSATAHPSPFVSDPAPVILAAEFHVVHRDTAETIQAMKHIANERKHKTPVGSTCGSVFKNPSTGSLTAGQLIDQAGLKGKCIGAAEISQRHGNYIVNLGDASSDDVLRLIELAQQTVLHTFGIELELEVQIIGGRKQGAGEIQL